MTTDSNGHLHVVGTVLCCMQKVAGPVTIYWGHKAVAAQFGNKAKQMNSRLAEGDSEMRCRWKQIMGAPRMAWGGW